MTLGQRLVQLRSQAGLSQDALAEQLGVSRQSVSKWETDTSIPDLDKLVKLSEVFDVSLDELVKGELPASIPSPAYTAVATPTEDTLRLHRLRIAGILLMVLSAAVTLLHFYLIQITFAPFLLGVVCLTAKKRPGLALGWTAWLCALAYTRTGTSAEMSLLLTPAYYHNVAALSHILAWGLLLTLVLLCWRTIRRPPGLAACWSICLGILLVGGLLHYPNRGWSLFRFCMYGTKPMGAILLAGYLAALVVLFRHTYQAHRNSAE